MKVCTSKKKGKTTVDLTRLKEEEEEQQGNFDSSLLNEKLKLKSPDVNNVPLKQDDHKSWLEFKKLDEGRPVLGPVSASDLYSDGRWSIQLDHPFLPFLVDFAISGFNEVRDKYIKKKKSKTLGHPEIMDCKYINMFKAHIFFMTMEVIEEGILGVYKVIVGCAISDGNTTLIHFVLTDRRPIGKIAMMLPHLISQKYRYKTMKAMKKDLEVIISETTEKSMKGKNKRKMAAELIRLKNEHKAMKGICKMRYRQIGSQIPKTWNDRNENDGDSENKPDRVSGLFPRSKLATCKGYDYYTKNSGFCVFSVAR